MWTHRWGRVQHICYLASNSYTLSCLTLVLTIYVLFGEDSRLWLTDKSTDWIFDNITIMAIAIFSMEIVVSCLGKAGYFCGFFFGLDIISTVTLLMEISSIAESFFGDSISRFDTASGGTVKVESESLDADAAKAARMSRAGSRASRVVRLVRLVRLVNLTRFRSLQRGGNSGEPGCPYPGMQIEDDDDINLLESAVSRKLSEMTTRRVIMLVLVILVALPFFQADMYIDDLPSSAQYGMNVLFRAWLEGLDIYRPMNSAAHLQRYRESRQRRAYEDDFFMYLYHHNPFCNDLEVPAEALESPLSNSGELFWLSVGPASLAATEYFIPQLGAGTYDPNARWNMRGWLDHPCNLTQDPWALFSAPPGMTERCIGGSVRGLSLVEELDCPEKLRHQERVVVYPSWATNEEITEQFFLFVFDRRKGSRLEAVLTLGQTAFICFLLGFGAMTFSNDANKLVLQPIERMIARINRIRTDPLSAIRMSDEAQERADMKRQARTSVLPPVLVNGEPVPADRTQSRSPRRLRDNLCSCITNRPGTPDEETPMETVDMEETIIKIGSLLALGFGEAGSEIFAQSMKGDLSATLNAMVPGRMVEAIFCHCAIQQFTRATEVIKDHIIWFVNRVAAVVHQCTNEYLGSPSKNMGGAFLLTWRLSGQTPLRQRQLADMAVIALVKMVARISKSPSLSELGKQKYLLRKYLGTYNATLGFGVHTGWAIEGAIGSVFKVDALYLGPNVSMSATLEGLTKQYGCLSLLSDSVMRLMSDQLREECRCIDHVVLEDSKGPPIRLYTMDLNDHVLEEDRSHNIMWFKQSKWRQRAELRMMLDLPDYNERLLELLHADPDICTMRKQFTREFFWKFKSAYLNYEAGEWGAAARLFQGLLDQDGPSVALFRFMKHHDCEAPQTWPGYRAVKETPCLNHLQC